MPSQACAWPWPRRTGSKPPVSAKKQVAADLVAAVFHGIAPSRAG
ncbi:hypothetical protein [Streptomyces sp. NBC_00059]|nr:hypothetical protein [Streptomyces sp. NBC_00059]MCX5414869.1 hypothetical protein [Streptomyces sp. NBC_00059]